MMILMKIIVMEEEDAALNVLSVKALAEKSHLQLNAVPGKPFQLVLEEEEVVHHHPSFLGHNFGFKRK